MGSKLALCAIADLQIGMRDTVAYTSEEQLRDGIRSSCAYHPRVLKRGFGSCGEGVWLCWLAHGEAAQPVSLSEYPAQAYGKATLRGDEILRVMDMADNHEEVHTVEELVRFCSRGRSDSGAGEWCPSSQGGYLLEPHGCIVDQRLLPRIEEGEVRLLMIGDRCFEVIHKVPAEGGKSAVGGNAAYTHYDLLANPSWYAAIVDTLMSELPQLKSRLGIADEPLPLLWTADFIPKDPDGWDGASAAPTELTEYVVGEFNCSCVGISPFQKHAGHHTLEDVPDTDYAHGMAIAAAVGRELHNILEGKGLEDKKLRILPKRPEVPSLYAC